MKDLSIRHTLTEICQTGIDLGRCAQVGLSTKGKIFFGSSETFCLLYPFIFGSPLKSTYYFASLGSAVLGLYGARQNQLWKSMVGGAIVGLTGTGFNILADSILGGSIVGLKSSAVRLAAGASGGALVAIATAHATKSSLEYKHFLGNVGMGMLGGVLLGAAVSGGLFAESRTAMDLAECFPNLLEPSSRVSCITAVGFCAIETDRNLSLMISEPNQHNTSIFSELLNKKECLSLIYNSSDELYSYEELLTLAIEHKVPADWLKMLSNKARGDYSKGDVVLDILDKLAACNSDEDKELYSQYLQHLLAEQVSSSINAQLLQLCDQTDKILCLLIEQSDINRKDEFSDSLLQKKTLSDINRKDEFSDYLLQKKTLSEIYRYIPEVSPKPYNELLTLAIEHKVPADWFKMLLAQSSSNITDDQFRALTLSIHQKIIASKNEESAEEYQSEDKEIHLKYLQYCLADSHSRTALSGTEVAALTLLTRDLVVQEGVPQGNPAELGTKPNHVVREEPHEVYVVREEPHEVDAVREEPHEVDAAGEEPHDEISGLSD